MKNHISIKDGFNFFNKSKIKAGDGLSEGDFPFYTSSSIQSKFLNDYEIEDESLIFGTGGSASIHYSKGKFSTSTDCFIIQSNNKYEIDLKYVYFYLFGNIHLLENGFKGAGLKHISKKYLEEIKIPLLPLETQKKIVEALDKAQALIDARKKQIWLMDELVKSKFIEMFGDPDKNEKKWEVGTLSDYINVIGGFAFKSEYFEDEGIPVLRIGNINSGKFKSTNMVFWKYDKALDRYAIYPGDLVMSLTGTVGKDDYGNVCFLSDEYDMYYLNQRNAKLVLNEQLNKFYLAYMLRFPAIKERLTGISRGVRQANISNNDILRLKLPVPSLIEQNQFADFVQQIDKSKLDMQNSIAEIKSVYDAMMQRYFE